MSYITEMGTGSNVSLVFNVNDKEIVKDTTVIGMLDPKYGQGIMCELIMHGGQVLNCSLNLSHVIVYDNISGNEYVFYKVRAVNVAMGNALVIYSADDVKPSDKRQAVRFPCDYDASFRVRSYPGTLPGQVRDISLTGIGCFIDNNAVEINEGDDIFVKVTGYDAQPNVVGTIARVIPHVDNPTFIGVHMKNPSELMLGIVHHLEKEQKKMTQFRR